MTSRLLEMCPYYFLHVPVFPIAKQPVFIEYECVFLCRNRTQAAVMKSSLQITSVRRFETFLWDRSSHQILPAPTDFTDHWIVLNKSKKTHLFFYKILLIVKLFLTNAKINLICYFFLQNANIITQMCHRHIQLQSNLY